MTASFRLRRALLALAAALPLRAAAFSLDETVDSALARAPGLRALEARRREAGARVREVRARRWPALRVAADALRSDDPVFVFGSLLRQTSFGPRNFATDFLNDPGYHTDVRSALELGMPVFTGFEIRSQGKLAGLALRRAELLSEEQSQRLRFAVVDAYLQVLLARQQLRVLEERLASASAELAAARRLKDKGLVLGSDYFAAEAIEAGLKAWRVQIGKKQESLRAALALWTSRDISAASLEGVLSPVFPPAPDEAALLAEALGRRPDLAAARLDLEAARLSAAQEGRSFLPRVEAFAAVETHSPGLESNPSTRVLGLRASALMGDPSYAPRKSRSAARRDAAREQAEQAEESARLEAIQALRGCQAAEESLPWLAEARDRAARALELFRPLYREGRQSILDVLRAEEGLARAEGAYLEALYQAHAGRARLRLVSGVLDRRAVEEIRALLEAAP